MPFQDLLQKLGQRFSDNLANSNQVIDDSTKQTLDRIRMSNPSLSGPRLPDTPTPQEQQMNEMMMNGVMGSVAPARAAVVKAGPWMQNITKEAVDAAIPIGEGLVNSTKDTIYTQAAKAAQKFEALKRKLGR